MKRIKEFIVKHYFGSQFVISLALGFGLAILYTLYIILNDIFEKRSIGVILSDVFSGLPTTFAFALVIFPFVLTVFQISYLIIAAIKGKESLLIQNYKKSALYDCIAFAFGVVLEAFLLSFEDVMFEADWNKELVNSQVHSPVNLGCMPTFLVLSALFFAGMLILAYTPHQKRPPLVTVFCMAGMYTGVIEAVLYTIQLLGMHYTDYHGDIHYKFNILILFTLFIPFNMFLILARTVIIQIKLYEPDENRMSKIEGNTFLSKCNRILCDSKNWPVLAIFAMIPLLGVVIAILALFGQAPDSAIKAFTETADYTLSTKIPPQNVFYDEHYLCTVAAGGHKKIVKPIRMGKRHGHDVVVNRQLMIANAFEQVLEEKTPRFHRAVRSFYDKYGFPVARLIKSKTVADIVWFIMKPLEWVFLFVLYLVDVNPEDRINKQYL